MEFSTDGNMANVILVLMGIVSFGVLIIVIDDITKSSDGKSIW